MAINVITGFNSSSREQLDKRSGPYASTNAALAALDTNSRAMGLPIYVIENGTQDDAGNYITGNVKTYYFTGGIADEHLTINSAEDFTIFGNRNSVYEVSEDTNMKFKEGEFQEEIISSLNATINLTYGLGGIHGFRYVEKYKSIYAIARDTVNGEQNVYIFSDLDDLSNYTLVTVSIPNGMSGSDQIIYSSYKDKLYFFPTDTIQSNGGYVYYNNLVGYELDPSDNSVTQVIDIDAWNDYSNYLIWYPVVTVLDNYLYVGFGTPNQKVLKISLDDYSVDSDLTLTFTNSSESIHNILTDGSKLYVTSFLNNSTGTIAAIESSNFSLDSQEDTVVSWTGTGGLSDDGTIVGDYIYVQTEGVCSSGSNGILKINKSDLTDQTLLKIPLNDPAGSLYAAYFDGIWIWYAGSNNTLGKYSPETNESYLYENPFTYSINEIRTDGQRIFVAGFDTYPVTNTGYVGRTLFPTEPIKKVILDSDGNQIYLLDYSTGSISSPLLTTSDIDAIGDTSLITKEYFYGNASGNLFDQNLNTTDDVTFNSIEVTNGVKIGNDTAAASFTNVGTLRYRIGTDSSFVDMCMQTGASTYEWVNIVENNWL